MLSLNDSLLCKARDMNNNIGTGRCSHKYNLSLQTSSRKLVVSFTVYLVKLDCTFSETRHISDDEKMQTMQ